MSVCLKSTISEQSCPTEFRDVPQQSVMASFLDFLQREEHTSCGEC